MSPEWGEWSEVKLLIREILDRQEKDIGELKGWLTKVVWLLITGVLGIVGNLVLNAIQSGLLKP